MTKYTADDFENARFATHPDGRLASRTFPEDRWPWLARPAGETDDTTDQYRDRDMAEIGWIPLLVEVPSQDALAAAVVRAEKAEQERDWNLRSSRIAKKARIEANARAERAEEERDEARASAYNWQATAEEWEKRALAAEPRPLTPDDITDEMVERARREWVKNGGRDYGDLPTDLRFAIAAALTEPSARPEGAEELDDLIEEWQDRTADGLADFLASRGVRVTGDAS